MPINWTLPIIGPQTVFAFSGYFVDFLLTSIHFPLSVRTVLCVMYAFGNTILVGNTIHAYTTTHVCLYHPATRMWLYPKPRDRVLDTATRLMTAQSKGCTATLLGQDSVWRNKAVSLLTKKIGVPRAVSRAYYIHTYTHTHTHTTAHNPV